VRQPNLILHEVALHVLQAAAPDTRQVDLLFVLRIDAEHEPSWFLQPGGRRGEGFRVDTRCLPNVIACDGP